MHIKTLTKNHTRNMEEKNHVPDDENNNNDNEDASRETESSVGGSRWNPTKEQIEMLERMYSHEGVRTPSAEQIQQITARLRVYGHIEGKNVFYWFQNHKARQRQKQRQERLVAAQANNNAHANVNHILSHSHHINRFLCPNLHHNPIFPAPTPTPTPQNYPFHYFHNPNVICSSPYYNLPQATNNVNNIISCNPLDSPHYSYNARRSNDHHHALMKRSASTKHVMDLSPGNGYCASMMKGHFDNGLEMMTRTLDLFPVHPTGILEHKLDGTSSTINSYSAETSSSGGSSSDNSFIEDENHRRLFDFFSGGRVSS